MPNELPHRLLLPSPDARSAHSPFEPDNIDFVDTSSSSTKRILVPVVQWGQIRVRGQISGGPGTIGLLFARPSRQNDPAFIAADLNRAFTYDSASQPAAQTTFWVDGVEFSLEIAASEHHGENWLQVQLNPTGGGGPQVVDFLDVSGELLGLYH